MNRTRELIRDEQTARDENVNEYLRLASQADKQQQIRLKAVFEKKNTKSAQQMQMLQRKLDTYQRRLRALEAQGMIRTQPHKAPKQVLRGVGMGIKYGDMPGRCTQLEDMLISVSLELLFQNQESLRI